MHVSSLSSFKARRRSISSLRVEDQPRFAGFTFDGNTSLDMFSDFYGLNIPALEHGMTLAQYAAKVCYGLPRAGQRIALRNAELVIQQLERGVITKVGLNLLPVRSSDDGSGQLTVRRRSVYPWRARAGKRWRGTAGLA
jgi:NhaP-type Na+/H+ and K+/H+ antiporter